MCSLAKYMGKPLMKSAKTGTLTTIIRLAIDYREYFSDCKIAKVSKTANISDEEWLWKETKLIVKRLIKETSKEMEKYRLKNSKIHLKKLKNRLNSNLTN